ncbi:N,N'-diacetyllegionaminic acid synthase [compost metagenome]
MVDRTAELDLAMGAGLKRVEENEAQTVILQRRAIRVAEALPMGTLITKEHLTVLRPCPVDGLPPFAIDQVIGKTLGRDVNKGEHLTWIDLK